MSLNTLYLGKQIKIVNSPTGGEDTYLDLGGAQLFSNKNIIPKFKI
jgi:hypothetical protein